MIRFKVTGKPIALKRHRMTKRGFTYDPSKKDKSLFLFDCMNHIPKEPLKGALHIEMMFIFKRPKSHFNRSGSLKSRAKKEHTSKPDIDNLVKFVLDSLSSNFFEDDRQVVSINALKVYDNELELTDVSIISFDS